MARPRRVENQLGTKAPWPMKASPTLAPTTMPPRVR